MSSFACFTTESLAFLAALMALHDIFRECGAHARGERRVVPPPEAGTD
jgi:hypothetical protein